MALAAATVFEVRNVADFAGAADTNGGAFVTGASGTDYSYANINANGSAKYALTNGVATTSSATIVTVSASADMIGNIAYVAGGTGTITGGWYQIISQVTGTSITLDRSTGLVTGTGVTINVGGSLATPGLAASIATVAGIIIWVRYSSTSYSMTTATPGSGGPVVMSNNSFSVATIIQGYDQTRGDRTGNLPKLSWASVSAPGSNTYIYSQTNNSTTIFANLAADGNTVTKVSGFVGPGSSAGIRVQFNNCAAYNCIGSSSTGGFVLFDNSANACYANNCVTGFSATSTSISLFDCRSLSCATGFNLSSTIGSCVTKCLATGGGTGFTTSQNCTLNNCTADSCVTSGFVNSSLGVGNTYNSCIASNMSGGGGVGFTVGSGDIMMNCASYNNTTEISGTPSIKIGMILNAAFTGGQPYVAAGSDFRPNATAGAGALLRATGIGVFGQTDAIDIGAVQHTDSGGSTYIFQVES